jgi:L-fuculose-phosphate aldolase
MVYRPDADELRAARAQLVSYSARLLDDGLAVGSAGNMSLRVGDVVAITPSGIGYHDMRPADVCMVTLDGAELDAPEEPYAATPARAVVHTHSAEVIALSAARDQLPAVHYAITGLGGPVRVARYARFGSAGLAAAAVAALQGRYAAILANHGAVTYGTGTSSTGTSSTGTSSTGTSSTGLAEAYDRALLLEWLARVCRLAQCYGEPAVLSAEQLEEVAAESRRRRYGQSRREWPGGGLRDGD